MTAQRLNYCSQASEMLTILDYESIGGNVTAIAMLARDTIILMHEATKFILPEWGRIFAPEEWKLCQDVQLPTRLPYPVVALEFPASYTMGYSGLADKETPSSKRIALCVEYEAMLSLTPDCYGKIASQCPLDDKRGFYIFPICFADAAGVWTPPPCGMFFPRGGNEAILADNKSGHIVITALGKEAYDYYPEHERLRRAARDCNDEALAMLHMMVALSIDKGRHETLPAPAKLNKKRAKKGRQPLYEYKVLDIVADVLAPTKETTNGREGGHHASPRMHTRRGHVRRLASGKTTWVRNTIVGKPSRGSIIKDYSVHE